MQQNSNKEQKPESIITPSGNTVYRTRYQAEKHRQHGMKTMQVYDGWLNVTPAGYRAILRARRG